MKDKIWKRNDVREDGYIFMRYMNHPNGKTYPVFMSPLALENKRKRNREWLALNKEKALESRRRWYRRQKETTPQPK